jgi:hypothetical protein
MSCKVFFRRNAFTNLTDLSCRDNGHCQMTKETRKHCTYCRLRTCFRVGMKKELFRMKENQHFNSIKTQRKKQFTANSRVNLQSNEYQDLFDVVYF